MLHQYIHLGGEQIKNKVKIKALFTKIGGPCRGTEGFKVPWCLHELCIKATVGAV